MRAAIVIRSLGMGQIPLQVWNLQQVGRFAESENAEAG